MSSVVFLRAVNVGGHQVFRPSVLAGQLSSLDAVNIGAAGTFVIPGRASEKEIRAEFARRIKVGADMIVCRGSDLLALVESDPFRDAGDLLRVVSAMSERPRTLPALPLCKPAGDRWEVKVVAVAGRFALSLRRRMGTSPLDPNAVVEKGFGVRATTRSWNTILKIREVLQS